MSETHEVNTWDEMGVKDILIKLQYLDKMDQVALVFVVPRIMFYHLTQQSIILLGTPIASQDVLRIIGCGRDTH